MYFLLHIIGYIFSSQWDWLNNTVLPITISILYLLQLWTSFVIFTIGWNTKPDAEAIVEFLENNSKKSPTLQSLSSFIGAPDGNSDFKFSVRISEIVYYTYSKLKRLVHPHLYGCGDLVRFKWKANRWFRSAGFLLFENLYNTTNYKTKKTLFFTFFSLF